MITRLCLSGRGTSELQGPVGDHLPTWTWRLEVTERAEVQWPALWHWLHVWGGTGFSSIFCTQWWVIRFLFGASLELDLASFAWGESVPHVAHRSVRRWWLGVWRSSSLLGILLSVPKADSIMYLRETRTSGRMLNWAPLTDRETVGSFLFFFFQ